ncbi:MAG: hypothetical protein J6585_08165 [Snodgrassella sp.]|nr:hypothetical protein [Snodgrassella sp.]
MYNTERPHEALKYNIRCI